MILPSTVLKKSSRPTSAYQLRMQLIKMRGEMLNKDHKSQNNKPNTKEMMQQGRRLKIKNYLDMLRDRVYQ